MILHEEDRAELVATALADGPAIACLARGDAYEAALAAGGSESDALSLGPDGGGVVVRTGGDGIGTTRAPVELRRITPGGRLGKAFEVRLPGRRMTAAAGGVFLGRTFGLAADGERTTVEVRPYGEILADELVDWTTLGQIAAIVNEPR